MHKSVIPLLNRRIAELEVSVSALWRAVEEVAGNCAACRAVEDGDTRGEMLRDVLDSEGMTASKTSWGSDMSIQVDGHKIGCLCVACEATRGVVAAAVDWAASHHGRADRDAAADGDVDEALRVAVEERAAAIRLPRREIPDPPAPPPPPEPDVTTKGG
jgi:hypothetical protein